jgi:hypothetical protein
MEHDDLVAQVRDLRAEGLTPKAIAKALGLTPAKVKPLIKEVAASSEVDPWERPLVDCRVNPEWSAGLSVDGHPEWLADVTPGIGELDGPQGLASVLVARRYKWGRVSVCGYLADVHCLGVKNALGPKIMADSDYPAFAHMFFSSYPSEPIEVPLELAQNLVFGAVDYARGLGFEPHPDFAPAAPYLGISTGPSAITFGRDGQPFFVQGPADNAKQVLETLDRTAGPGNYHYILAIGDPAKLS